jgi:hypothetical protein
MDIFVITDTAKLIECLDYLKKVVMYLHRRFVGRQALPSLLVAFENHVALHPGTPNRAASTFAGFVFAVEETGSL